MNIGEKIRALREKHGWSQQYVADRLGYCDKTAISKIEKSDCGGMATTALKKFAELYNVSPLYFLSDNDDEIPEVKPPVLRVPVLGRIPAGIPIEAITDIEDYEEMYDMPGEYFALKVKGDSMMPRIQPDSVVIFRSQSDCENGQICAVMVNGNDATLKKVVKSEAGIMLMPLNSAYEPKFFSNAEIASLPVRILGVAIEVRCKL